MANSMPRGTVGSLRDFADLDESSQYLVRQSVQARERAYCPYSNFQVGAAVLCPDGLVFEGCNVETSSFASVCAERCAIAKAVSAGSREFTKISVAGDLPGRMTAPCGTCRQFIAEFSRDTEVLLCKPDMKEVLVTSIQELLPLVFDLKE